MQLLAIKEPQPQISSQSNKIAVGIDLGTTNSLIAISREGKIEIITSEQGERLIPSVVGYTSHGILVGSKAKKLLDRPEATVISSVKRLMGKGLSEATDIAYNIPINLYPAITKNDQIKLDVQGRSVTPTEVSAEILKSLKTIAEYQLNTSQIQAVITVPAYFDESARLATKTAAKLAGLEVLRLINEPTAAALAYGLDQKIEGTYLIYDLGGGTFDISILKIENGVFQVLATGGNVLLGGDDFDQAIVEEILRENPQIQLCPDVISHLLVVAKEIKESLSIDEKVHKQFMVKGSMIDFALTRKHFEFLIEKYIDETIRITENTICDANIPQNKINGIALVGGSTRLPVITEKLTNRFGITPFSHINPDEAVVIGAALQAENLTSKSSHLLLDVNPLSLGIEVMGGLVERIIPRNSPIPVSVTKDFTTFKDNQTGIQFHIVQGERELAKDCRSLARFELKDIPPMLAGMARITVNFTIDADGLLVVTAYENTTNIEYKTTVNSSYGLSDKQIEEMLYDSLENAVIDVQEKLLIETKVEAESLIVAVNRALSNNQQNLDQIEKQNISLQLAKIKQALHSNDRDNLKSYIQSLERAAEPLIGKNLEMFLNEKVRGKAISDVYNSLQQDDENEK